MTTTPTSDPTSPAESDPFFQLLTDALRAGPGSAQWDEAVAKLRDGGVQGGDEYNLLLRAREDVGLGRDFRKVSAGPEFTRKVLDAVEREGRKRSGIPTATIVAILSGAVILGVIVTVIVMMSRGGSDTGISQQAAVERLERENFTSALASAEFTKSIPPDWRTLGTLPLAPSRSGLVARTAPGNDGAAVGGLVSTEPLDAGVAVAVDVELHVPEVNSGTPVQIFVSDAADFTDAKSPAHEILVTVHDERATLDVNGTSVALPGTIRATPKGGSILKVVIRFDRDVAIVDVGGRRLYAGPHGLPPDKPRYAGVRFVRAAGNTESAAVRSISLSQSTPGGGR